MAIERTRKGRPGEHADGPPVARRRPSLPVALVAGTVLVAGISGAYWAAWAAAGARHEAPRASASDDAGTSGKAGGPPPLALNGWTGADPSSGSPGPVYRTAVVLPPGPESAHVYRAVDQVPRADVLRLAAALGVRATVRLDGGIWRAGAAPGTKGPALEVNQDAPGNWVFSRYGTAPPCRPGTARPGSRTAVCYSADGSATSSGSRPAATSSPASPDAAMHAAAPVLAAVGLVGRPVDSSQTAGTKRTIVVDPVFGGLPTHGWRTSLQVASDGGLLSATGRLARVAPGPVYPVVSAQRALQEMRARGGGVPVVCPTSQPGTSTGSDTTGIRPGGPVLRPSSGGPCVPGWAAQPLEVRGATFGLSAQFVSGRPELVPSWLFQVAPDGDGQPYTVAQPAVDPQFLTR